MKCLGNYFRVSFICLESSSRTSLSSLKSMRPRRTHADSMLGRTATPGVPAMRIVSSMSSKVSESSLLSVDRFEKSLDRFLDCRTNRFQMECILVRASTSCVAEANGSRPLAACSSCLSCRSNASRLIALRNSEIPASSSVVVCSRWALMASLRPCITFSHSLKMGSPMPIAAPMIKPMALGVKTSRQYSKFPPLVGGSCRGTRILSAEGLRPVFRANKKHPAAVTAGCGETKTNGKQGIDFNV